MRVIEVVLICLVAFGGSILISLFMLCGHNYSMSPRDAFGWIVATVREGSMLGLLWYVLLRRGKSFHYLGLAWTWTDLGWSILLRIAGGLAFTAVYQFIYVTGLTAVSHRAASAHVGQLLFAGGISFATILFQFVNPFFEELIVRAYVMTEVKALTGSVAKAIIVSTVLQTGYHFYQGVPAALAHGATFLIWSLYYAKTNRIAPVILAHLYSDLFSTLWYLIRQWSGTNW